MSSYASPYTSPLWWIMGIVSNGIVRSVIIHRGTQRYLKGYFVKHRLAFRLSCNVQVLLIEIPTRDIALILPGIFTWYEVNEIEKYIALSITNTAELGPMCYSYGQRCWSQIWRGHKYGRTICAVVKVRDVGHKYEMVTNTAELYVL